jgi:hypothetical protein
VKVSVSERIARRRPDKKSEQRSAAQLVVYRALSKLKPNQLTNIRCPWKRDPFVMRAWCPFHPSGEWVRLIVRTTDDGHTTFECERGCANQNVNRLVSALAEAADADRHAEAADGARAVTPDGISSSAESAMCAGDHRQNGLGSTSVLDGRHRFQFNGKTGGARDFGFDDPAA